MKHRQNGSGRIGVGSTVVAQRATSVCYEVYTLDNRPGYSVLFESGRYDGFSPDEVATMLRVTGRCDALAGYEFRNVQQLIRDMRPACSRRSWRHGQAPSDRAPPGGYPARFSVQQAADRTPYLCHESRAMLPRRPSFRRSWSIRSRRQDAASSSLRTVKPNIPLRAATANPVGENSANCIGPVLLR